MLLDDEALRQEFEEKHASLDEEALKEVLGTDNPYSHFYEMPDELVSKTLEAVRDGYEEFSAGRPESPRFFAQTELEDDLRAYLTDMRYPDSNLGIWWDGILSVYFPEPQDFSWRMSEDEAEVDYAALDLAREDAQRVMLERAPQGVEAMTHNFECYMAYAVTEDELEGYLPGFYNRHSVDFDVYDNTGRYQ